MSINIKRTMNLRRVVVTGLGIVTSMGLDVHTVWQRLLAGKSGITRLDSFNEKSMSTLKGAPEDFPLIGGVVGNFNLKDILQARKKDLTKDDLKQIKYTDLFTQFALAASLEAIDRKSVV